MSLLKKIERDTLQRQCKKEVEALHAVFVAWFQGTRPKVDLEADLEVRLQYSFSHVAPNGMMVLGRPGLLSQLQDKYGCYHDRVFEIDIYNVQLLWTDTNQCLCTYEEWQSWKSSATETAAASSDGVDYGYEDPDAVQRNEVNEKDDDEEEELVQFGRLSTCLLERKSDGPAFTWIHVHETWLEAERPPEGPRAVLTGTEPAPVDHDEGEAQSIMTGPQQVIDIVKHREEPLKNTDKEMTATPLSTLEIVVPPVETIPQPVAVRNLEPAAVSTDEKQPQIKHFPPLEDQDQPQDSESSSTSSGSDESSGSESDEQEEDEPYQNNDNLGQDQNDYSNGSQNETQDEPIENAGISNNLSQDKNNHINNNSNIATNYGHATAYDKMNNPHGADNSSTYDHDDEDHYNCRRVIILMSNACISREQLSQQKMAFRILQAEEIPYEEVDGTDFNHRGRREVLFNISGKRGVYPQFFVAEGDQIAFWGDWNRFDQVNYQGMLKQELGLTEGEEEDEPDDDEDEGEEEDSQVPSDDDEEAEVEEQFSERNEQLSEQHPDAHKVDSMITGEVTSTKALDQRNDNHQNVFDQRQLQQPSSTHMNDKEAGQKSSQQESYEKESILKDRNDINNIRIDKGHNSGKQVQNQKGSMVGAGTVTVSPTTKVLSVKEEYDNYATMDPKERDFLEASHGILEFEPEDRDNGNNDDGDDEDEELESDKDVVSPTEPTELDHNGDEVSPIPQDVSPKRHISPKLNQYAKPLRWENALVGVSIAGFDIGTSQGPIGDEAWYEEMGKNLEEIAQSRSIPRPRRKLCLPEMVFPTAHVAIEGHGLWLSWDVVDALKAWAKCHQDISVHSRIAYNGVSVLRSKDATLWDSKRKHKMLEEGAVSVFHYDWTYSTPFCGRVDGGEWQQLDESGMRMSLLTDQSVPILFFDDIVLYEDDMHDNGQVQYSIKLRVMPSCAYFLARLWVLVDNVLVRVRETRVLVDFFGMKPQVFRDLSWRELKWDELKHRNLPTDVRPWHIQGRETPEWNELVRSIPEVELPRGMFKHAVLRTDNEVSNQTEEKEEV